MWKEEEEEEEEEEDTLLDRQWTEMSIVSYAYVSYEEEDTCVSYEEEDA
jgi:hypothetical protein